MEAKKLLEEAIANSTASEYDKGNILYLAETHATACALERSIEELEMLENSFSDTSPIDNRISALKNKGEDNEPNNME